MRSPKLHKLRSGMRGMQLLVAVLILTQFVVEARGRGRARYFTTGSFAVANRAGSDEEGELREGPEKLEALEENQLEFESSTLDQAPSLGEAQDNKNKLRFLSKHCGNPSYPYVATGTAYGHAGKVCYADWMCATAGTGGATGCVDHGWCYLPGQEHYNHVACYAGNQTYGMARAQCNPAKCNDPNCAWSGNRKELLPQLKCDDTNCPDHLFATTDNPSELQWSTYLHYVKLSAPSGQNPFLSRDPRDLVLPNAKHEPYAKHPCYLFKHFVALHQTPLPRFIVDSSGAAIGHVITKPGLFDIASMTHRDCFGVIFKRIVCLNEDHVPVSYRDANAKQKCFVSRQGACFVCNDPKYHLPRIVDIRKRATSEELLHIMNCPKESIEPCDAIRMSVYELTASAF